MRCLDVLAPTEDDEPPPPALLSATDDDHAEPGLTMTIYAAEPGSPTEQALALLASWAATQAQQSAERQTHPDEPAARRS